MKYLKFFMSGLPFPLFPPAQQHQHPFGLQANQQPACPPYPHLTGHAPPPQHQPHYALGQQQQAMLPQGSIGSLGLGFSQQALSAAGGVQPAPNSNPFLQVQDFSNFDPSLQLPASTGNDVLYGNMPSTPRGQQITQSTPLTPCTPTSANPFVGGFLLSPTHQAPEIPIPDYVSNLLTCTDDLLKKYSKFRQNNRSKAALANVLKSCQELKDNHQSFCQSLLENINQRDKLTSKYLKKINKLDSMINSVLENRDFHEASFFMIDYIAIGLLAAFAKAYHNKDIATIAEINRRTSRQSLLYHMQLERDKRCRKIASENPEYASVLQGVQAIAKKLLHQYIFACRDQMGFNAGAEACIEQIIATTGRATRTDLELDAQKVQQPQYLQQF